VSNPVNLHWIAHVAHIQCKFTGSPARHTSGEISLDCLRGTHPVKFH
jgi:hypothetical protein